MPELYNYVSAPNYTSSEETEKVRRNMKTAIETATIQIKTFNMVASNLGNHIMPFEEKYEEEAARSASAKAHVSLEERIKRHSRKNRNRRGKQSRKVHQKKRKIAKITKKKRNCRRR